MIALRTLAVLAVAAIPVVALPAAPAGAHGALSNPMSRVVACGPDGGQRASSAACRAAVAANGESFDDWSNLRVPDVAGRDREVIPDGELCSGGLDRYKGLDLARADWPTTRLRPGAAYTFSYGETIPHKGEFRLYVTRAGYDPTRPLRWSDLESKPFLAVTDPVLKDDAYVIKGRLPKGKTGRHLIYTIWQNSDTPDTYYSCSDVVFTPAGSGSGGAGARSGGGGARKGGASAAAGSPADSSNEPELLPVADTRRTVDWTLMAAGTAVAVAAVGVGAVILLRRRRPARGAHRHGAT